MAFDGNCHVRYESSTTRGSIPVFSVTDTSYTVCKTILESSLSRPRLPSYLTGGNPSHPYSGPTVPPSYRWSTGSYQSSGI